MTTRVVGVDWASALAGAERPVGVPLGEYAHGLLFQAIVQGRIGPDQHLAEQPIAEAIGVSRISIRDAIRQLAAAGLVSIYPNRGAYTIGFTPQDIEEIFSLRAALETLAIRLVARNVSRTDLARLEDIVDEMRAVEAREDRFAGAWEDARFHGTLMEVSGHSRAYAAWRNISAQITMAVYSAASYYEVLGSLAERHEILIEVLRSGDPDQAEELIVQHIIHGSRLLLEAIGRQQLLEQEKRHHQADSR